MNIKKAKEQIKNAMKAYFTRDELGNYLIPVEKQRPVFLIGPPGIGKTAIMEQIASELGVGLLTYSMTHHTRQSAIGLPFIAQKTYDGQEYSITEYTMSEIIASVYELMEASGVREGILFLDEINCVSETLSPLMLQFLQYKIFGRHRVPDGWIVVTAGNPPEYNESVREFDVVTLDRLKKIEVEPDFDVWKEYASSAGVHPAVLTFLEIKKSYLYLVETTVEGKNFVTPRGWEDLSKMLRLYERHGMDADADLIVQYLQNRRVAGEFAAYYELFRKYREDYRVDRILAGKADAKLKKRAREAKFDERLSLVGLLLDGVCEEIRAVMEEESWLSTAREDIAQYKKACAKKKNPPQKELDHMIRKEEKALKSVSLSGALSAADRIRRQRAILFLREMAAATEREDDPAAAYETIKTGFNDRVRAFSRKAGEAGQKLSHLFAFAEEVFGEGQELLIIVTELTANYHTAAFIGEFGCEEYFRHNKELLFYERQKEIIRRIEDMEQEDG